MGGSTPFIGRHLETAAVAELLDGLPRTGGTLIVRGDPGLGKTAFGLHAVQLADQSRIRVLSTSAAEAEAQMPFAALEYLVRPHAKQLAALRPRQRESLEAALGLRPGPAPDVYLVGLAFLDLLSEVGADKGVMVLIDDVHWIDASTAHVLSFVARRLRSEPVVMVLTLRPGYPSPVLDSKVPFLDLLPLTSAESQALLESSRPELHDTDKQSVLSIARGNPLALLELAPSTEIGENSSSTVMTARLQRAFALKFEGLSTESRTALLVAAVSDGDSLNEILDASALLARGEPLPPGALEAATSTGAFIVEGTRVRFRHPLVRAAVIESAAPSEVRAAHGALALTLQRSPERAAWHQAESIEGFDEAAAAALESVADGAQAHGNPSVALRALAGAVRLTAGLDARAHRELRAAEVAIELGRIDRATDIALRVDAESLSLRDRARLALLRDSLDTKAHGEERIAQLVFHSQKAMDASDLDLAVSLLLAAGSHLNEASYGITSGLAEDATRRLSTLLGESDPRVLAVLAAIDPLPYAELVLERVSHMDATSFDPRMELLVSAAFVVDADPGLASLQTAIVDGYRVRGRLRSIAHVQTMHCWTQITLANWPEALAAADEGVRLAHEIRLPRREAGATIGQAMIEVMRGNDVEAGRLIAESESIARTRGAQDVLTGVQLTKGVRYISLGRHDEAVSALKRSFNSSDPSAHPLQAQWSLGDLAEAGYHSNRMPEVRHIFNNLNPLGASTPWQKMAEQYAQPFIASGQENIEAAFRTALTGIVENWPAYHARLILEHGRWLRRANRISDARDALRVARDAADALSMRPWAALARQELAATGEDSVPFAPKAWQLLSPQELQVALMAGEGLSNKEIAERLFLSHRTVGSHLYRLFPKLGVANRAQLAALVGGGALTEHRLP